MDGGGGASLIVFNSRDATIMRRIFVCACLLFVNLSALALGRSEGVILFANATTMLYPGVTAAPFGTAGALLYTDGSKLQAAPNVQISSDGSLDVPYSTNMIFMELQGAPYITFRGSANEFWGTDSSSVTGYGNFVAGHSAGAITSGYDNAFGGESAGAANGAGYFNTAFGAYALQKNTANNNTAFGAEAGQNNVSGIYLTAVGAGAANAWQSGTGMTAVGGEACQDAVSVNAVACFGQDSLLAHVSGDFETALGVDAGLAEIDAQSNTFVGAGAAYVDVHGGYNSIVGAQTVIAATSLTNTEVLGRYDLPYATTVSDCIIIGVDVGGTSTTTGCTNSVIIGNVSPLTANPTNVIILADGSGNIRADYGYTTSSAWTFAGGATKTCSTLPTVAGGIVTSC